MSSFGECIGVECWNKIKHWTINSFLTFELSDNATWMKTPLVLNPIMSWWFIPHDETKKMTSNDNISISFLHTSTRYMTLNIHISHASDQPYFYPWKLPMVYNYPFPRQTPWCKKTVKCDWFILNSAFLLMRGSCRYFPSLCRSPCSAGLCPLYTW